MSLSQNLIELIRNKPISDDDLASAARFSLDAVASAYAGSATPVGKILLDWACNNALDNKRRALLMGALTHITETDDLHRASVTHPGCVVVPTTLSLGEQLGASGEQILRATLHGFEAMCRIGAAVGSAHYKVWHNTATCGVFGAAMAAASLRGLTIGQTVDALGNAGTQASGFWQFMATGAMSKHLHAGRACESGLLAAELAAHGFSGPPEIIEGEKGFFAAMCTNPQPEAIIAEANAPWQLKLTSIKPWPSCRHTHPAIDCALELHAHIGSATVESVEIETYQAALDVCDRPHPDSAYQAKFSLHHCVATALLNGAVTLDSFTPPAREGTRTLRAMTSLHVIDPFAARYPQSWGSAVRVNLSDGRVLFAKRDDCKGDPEDALSQAEMLTKAQHLLQYGGLDHAQADRVSSTVLSLANQHDIHLFSDFMHSLNGGALTAQQG